MQSPKVNIYIAYYLQVRTAVAKLNTLPLFIIIIITTTRSASSFSYAGRSHNNTTPYSRYYMGLPSFYPLALHWFPFSTHSPIRITGGRLRT